MGAGVFHGRVRDGNGCCNPAMATRPPQQDRAVVGVMRIGVRLYVLSAFHSGAVEGQMVLRAVIQ